MPFFDVRREGSEWASDESHVKIESVGLIDRMTRSTWLKHPRIRDATYVLPPMLGEIPTRLVLPWPV